MNKPTMITRLHKCLEDGCRNRAPHGAAICNDCRKKFMEENERRHLKHVRN